MNAQGLAAYQDALLAIQVAHRASTLLEEQAMVRDALVAPVARYGIEQWVATVATVAWSVGAILERSVNKALADPELLRAMADRAEAGQPCTAHHVGATVAGAMQAAALAAGRLTPST